MLPYEELEHTADYALRATGRDLSELIGNAGRGMISLMLDAEGMAAERTLEVEVSADSAEALVVRALKEVLWAAEGGYAPVALEVTRASADPPSARLVISLARTEGFEARWRGIIKAVTYHNLAISERDGILSVTVTFDV